MENTLLLILPAAVATALLVTLTVIVAVRRRRRRTKMASTLSWIGALTVPLDTLAPSGYGSSEHPVEAGSVAEPFHVRTLRAHVRALEEALEQGQRQQPIAAAAPGEDLEVYRRQVHAAIRAMGGRTRHDEAGDLVLARVSAAIERLSAPEVFARPALSPSGRTALLSHSSSAPTLQSVPLRAPSTLALDTQECPPAVDSADLGDAAASYDDERDWTEDPGVASVSAEPETVLPVPPMTETEQSRRGRRWFRGRAA